MIRTGVHLDRHMGDTYEPIEPSFVNCRWLRSVRNHYGDHCGVPRANAPQVKVGNAITVYFDLTTDRVHELRIGHGVE